MKQRTLALLTTGILSTLLFAAPGLAGDYSAGREASGEAPRAMGSASEFKGARAKPVPGIEADRSASRDILLDDAAIEKAYTIIGRSSDGRDVKLAPSDAVIDAIKNAKAGGKRTEVEGGGGDPADEDFRAPSSARTIACRSPNRRPIPIRRSAISRWRTRRVRCGKPTAALIGPKTAITAANCLYNHAEGGWRDKVVFWPAVNGENNAPYGGFDYDTEYVFQAYVTDYDGTYDGIWQYDIGLVTFKDPIGDLLDGWATAATTSAISRAPSSATTTTSRPSPCGSRLATCWLKTSRRPTLFTAATAPAEPTVRRSIIMTRLPRAVWWSASRSGPSGDANWALKLTPGLVQWDQLGYE